MAHIPQSAAIFSPSIARLASSTAKDWNYVDSWLSSRFHGRPAPPFERNPETLKALVALAALNESADEDRSQVASIEVSNLQALSSDARGKPSEVSTQKTIAPSCSISATSPFTVAERILSAIEDGLTREGQGALESMARASVELGIALPQPAVVGCKITELQSRLFQLKQDAARCRALQTYVEKEAVEARALLKELDAEAYRPAADLSKLNLELQRRIKMEMGKLQESSERAAGVDVFPEVTIQQLQAEESTYLNLLAYKGAIDKQIKLFQGLPPDRDLAQRQLKALQAELQTVSQERDDVFEGLVEHTTPKWSG